MLRFWKKGVLLLLTAACLLSCSLQAEAADAPCPDYNFEALDGSRITPQSNAGRVTLIIFAHLGASHTDSGELIKALDGAQWSGDPNLSIVMVDWMNGSADQIRQYVAAYIGEDSSIQFCKMGDTQLYPFLEAIGKTESFSVPLGILVGADGKIKGDIGGNVPVQSYEELLAPYVDSVEVAQKVTLSVTGTQGYAEAFKILELINEQRQANGLGALKMDKELLDAAMQRAAECTVYYSHTRPEGASCFTVNSRASAENIAIGYQNAQSVMEGWMTSMGHRKNILAEGITSVGVGVFYHNGIYTWVQLFSRETAITVKKPADGEKTRQVKTLQAHIHVEAKRSLLMVKKGETQTAQLYFKNPEFEAQLVYPGSENITYTSSDPKVAKVDAKGVITGLKNGTAQITMTLKGTDKKAVVTVEVSEHLYDEWQYYDPSCSAPGSARYRCEECDEWIDREIPALTEHAWDEGTVTRKPTTTQKGEKLFTCQNCGDTKTASIPSYSAPKPAPTQPATKAPTQAATKAPTVPITDPPTAAPTMAPTAATTIAATQPAVTMQPTTITTQPTDPTQIATEPSQIATEPSEIPIPEPTEMPSETLPAEVTEDTTEPAESSPEFIPETQPTQADTQLPTEPELPTAEAPDNKLLIGVGAMAALAAAAGAFLIFWKRRK